MTHRGSRFHTVICHVINNIDDILIGIPENLIEFVAGLLIMGRKPVIWNRQTAELFQMKAQPFPVRISADLCIFAFIVIDDPFFQRISNKDLSRHQT